MESCGLFAIPFFVIPALKLVRCMVCYSHVEPHLDLAGVFHDHGTHPLDHCPHSSDGKWQYSVPDFVEQDYFGENFHSSRVENDS